MSPGSRKLLALPFIVLFGSVWLYLLRVSQQWIERATDPQEIEALRRFHGYLLISATLAGLLITALLLQLAFTRWRSLKVFVSYHLEDRLRAQELVAGLRARYIFAEIYYCASAEHDEAVEAVRSRLKHADSLLVLPGTTMSFVDAEILAATVSGKTVVLLADSAETLPNTAYTGYPVFIYSELRDRDFKPLADFLEFIHGYFESLLELFATRLGMLILFSFIPYIVVSAAFEIMQTIALHGIIYGWGSPSLLTIAATIGPIISFSFLLAYWISANNSRRRAAGVARQRIITGTATYSVLAECLPPFTDITKCLRKAPLSTRYEA